MPSQAKRFNKVLIVGLGNPGMEYEATRHNIGFRILDTFFDETWKDTKNGNAQVAKTSVDGVEVYLMKPQTFMNKSGEAVQPFATYFKIDPEAVIVVHDEADIPFGEIRAKQGGGTAGHNGLKSLVQRLGTENFWRVRFGIGKSPNPNIALDDFVLGKWSEAERQQLPTLIEQTIRQLHELIVAPPQDK